MGRVQKTLPFQVVAAYGESKAGNYAAALAFASFLAMFPMMLLGALYNQFRLSRRGTTANMTSAAGESRTSERPADVIKRNKTRSVIG